MNVSLYDARRQAMEFASTLHLGNAEELVSAAKAIEDYLAAKLTDPLPATQIVDSGRAIND